MVNKNIQNLLIGIVSSVIGGVLLWLVPEKTFGFDWSLFLEILWNYEVRFIYLISLFVLFIILYFNKGKRRPKSWFEMEKFKYNGALWSIGLYTKKRCKNKNKIYKNYSIDDIEIKNDPICPQCNTSLKDTSFIPGHDDKGKWKCLDEKCNFEISAPASFLDAKNDALKVWKYQNTSKFQ